MKIKCEHCGGIIDTNYEKKCNNCGAPYTNNKEYKEHLKKEQEFKEHVQEFGTKVLDNTAKSMAATRVITIFIFLVFFTIFLSAIIFMTSAKNDSNIIINNNTNDKDSTKNTVSFNENDSHDNYEIKCDKVIKYEGNDYIFDKKDDFEYYSFHIVFKNKTYMSLLSEIILTYTDEDGNDDVVSSRQMVETNNKEYLDIVATKEGTYTGYVVYGIPKYVKDVNIKYRDTIISIKNFKDKME